MQFDGRLGIISGRYHSLDGSNGGKDHQTILEVFGRCEDGRSICLLIKGLQPSFEITPLSAWQIGQEIPEQLKARIKLIAGKEDVVKNLDAIGPDGQNIYILSSLILDTLYPILYSSLFILSIQSCNLFTASLLPKKSSIFFGL